MIKTNCVFIRIICGFFVLSSAIARADTQHHARAQQPSYKLGIENSNDPVWQKLFGGGNSQQAIGLVTNQTGQDQQGRRTVDILLQRGLCVKRIFAPEHGVLGVVDAAHEVGDTVDHVTKIPVVSLYGHGTGRKIAPHTIKDLDVLIFDMQDSGMRHYTYISTLLHVMEAAAHHQKPIVILDRPNPLGAHIDGPISGKHTKSFIAIAPMPLRHGMTIGELAHYFNNHVLEQKAMLHVVSMQDYKRTMGLPGKLAAPLSPNIPNKRACYGYSFLGLLGEVRPFDTGLGTPKAMQCLALSEKLNVAPHLWQQLHANLKKCNINSTAYSYMSPRKNQQCHGLLFSVADINKVASFDIMVMVLKFFHDNGVHLTFSKSFDTAVGSHKVHDYVKGRITRQELVDEVNTQLTLWQQEVIGSYLYQPLPYVAVMR
ncbi:MAG: DUF1343 domain-containing protein [Candidatus Dependentiae bacterium]|nr:DUF1343 domain-containing protein [Candidatus Dependentiae bacterium]